MERTSELEYLESLITEYKTQTDEKRKHVVYIRLVEESLKLVKKIVSTVYSAITNVPREDLIQIGAVGMLKAIDTYKIEERGSFKTYVTKVIKGQILHFLRDKANLVRPPREMIANITKVKDAINELSGRISAAPTTEEIANHIGLSTQKVEEIMNLEQLKNMVSLDQTIYTTDGNETLLDRIHIEQDVNFEETYANKKIIEFALNKLQKNDRIAITMYYMEEATRQDIANVLNVSKTQVSRIIKKALNRLYDIIQKEMSEDYINKRGL